MQKSIYTSVSGAIAAEKALDVIANNLANVNTTAYKSDRIAFKQVLSEPYEHYAEPLPPANYKVDLEDVMPLKGNEISYVAVDRVFKDLSQGSEIVTGNPLDVMIRGGGFFTVQTKSGEMLTRDGSFSVDHNGSLVTKQGDLVVGEKGAITLSAAPIKINNLGEIYQNGELVDRIVIKEVEEEASLQRAGHNYFLYGGHPDSIKEIYQPSVTQGSLEGSNVNAIKNLTDMILLHRSHEAYHKSLKNYDSMMEKANTQIARVQA